MTSLKDGKSTAQVRYVTDVIITDKAKLHGIYEYPIKEFYDQKVKEGVPANEISLPEELPEELDVDLVTGEIIPNVPRLPQMSIEDKPAEAPINIVDGSPPAAAEQGGAQSSNEVQQSGSNLEPMPDWHYNSKGEVVILSLIHI